MSTPRKILHVISQRPDSTGSGIYLQAMLRESARKGYKNYLVAATQSDDPVKLPGITPENCHFVIFDATRPSERIVGMSDVMPYPSRRFQDLGSTAIEVYHGRFLKTLTGMISCHHPDLIHSHHLWLLSALIKKQFPDIPLITSCHGSDLRQLSQCPHLREQVRDGCRHIDKVLALSAEQKNEIAEKYRLPPKRINIAGAGYDNHLFHTDIQRKPGLFNILYAGKISRAKGVPWLLSALGAITSHPFHLHLAGGGSGKEFHECRADAAKLGSRLSFHGMVCQQALADLMRRCHLFILPSLHEGLPLVVLEALACGCTVIATDLPGTREIACRLQTRKLILVDKPVILDTDQSLLADENRFIDALKHSIESCLCRQYGDNGDQTDLSYFSWKSVFERIEQCWTELLDKLIFPGS